MAINNWFLNYLLDIYQIIMKSINDYDVKK